MKLPNLNIIEAQLTAHQVSADLEQVETALAVTPITLSEDSDTAAEHSDTLIEIQDFQLHDESSTPDQQLGTKKRIYKSRRKKGGWPTTRYIPSKDVKAILEGIHQLTKLKKRLTHFITLRPPPRILGDQAQKLWCRRKIQNLQRKFARRHAKFIACHVYEKKDNGPLHVHILVHVPKRLSEVLTEMHSPPEIDIRPARAFHTTYIVKNRKWQGPECEKWLRNRLGLRWQKGTAFRGKRWDWSTDAKRLLKIA